MPQLVQTSRRTAPEQRLTTLRGDSAGAPQVESQRLRTPPGFGAPGVCVLIAAIVAAAVLTVTWTPDWLANDTAQTLSVAREIAHHGRIATDIIYYEEHLRFSHSPVPQTVFPPGYPALIAALMQLGISDVTSARVLVAISFAVVPLLILWSLRRLGLEGWWAAAISLMWLALQPIWWNAQGLQSELPFIACTLGSFVCLLISHDKPAQWRWILISGALTALACSLRYAGVFFALAAGLVLAGNWLIRRRRPEFIRAAAFSILPFLMLSAMFVRNASLVGDIKGGNNQRVMKPVFDVLRTTWYSITDLWSWSRRGLLSGEASELLLLVGVLTGVASLILKARQTSHVSGESADSRRFIGVTLLPSVYCITSLACLFWLEMTTSVGLCPRLLLPIVPFLLIAFGQVVHRLEVPFQGSRIQWLPATVILFAIFLGQLELWAQHEQPHVVSKMRAAIADLSARSDDLSWRELMELADGRPILCNESHCVSNTTRHPVIGLAAEMYTSREWNHDSVQLLVERFDVRLVLIFTEIVDEAEESTRYFESLLTGDVPPWLTPIVTDGPIRAYIVTGSHF